MTQPKSYEDIDLYRVFALMWKRKIFFAGSSLVGIALGVLGWFYSPLQVGKSVSSARWELAITPATDFISMDSSERLKQNIVAAIYAYRNGQTKNKSPALDILATATARNTDGQVHLEGSAPPNIASRDLQPMLESATVELLKEITAIRLEALRRLASQAQENEIKIAHVHESGPEKRLTSNLLKTRLELAYREFAKNGIFPYQKIDLHSINWKYQEEGAARAYSSNLRFIFAILTGWLAGITFAIITAVLIESWPQHKERFRERIKDLRK